jgi:6-phosphogluconolactonase
MREKGESAEERVSRSVTAAEACRRCAVHLAGVLKAALAEAPGASLAVSGGRTPAAMFDSLAAMDLEWDRVHVWWVDERAVGPDDEQSNYGMALRHLIGPAGVRAEHVHRMLGEISPHEAARRYEHEIRAHFGCGLDGMPKFDAVQLGVGDDGHTASLFPGDPLIENRVGIAAATYSTPAAQWRVTLLPGPILAARNIAVLACGAGKAEALERVWSGANDPMQCPAQILTREGRQAKWFLDEAAAARLVS